MFSRFRAKFHTLLLKAKLTKPTKILGTVGISSYIIGMGIWIYIKPEALMESTTKTVHQLSRVSIPKFGRKLIYNLYANRYGVNLEEVEKPLTQYNSLNQFFTRKIKNRPIQPDSMEKKMILSPSDSTVLSISEVNEDRSLIVKDITYSLSQFLYQLKNKETRNVVEDLKINKNSKMYQVILYLSPGDYHRFHSPTNLIVKATRDVSGKLRPVNLSSLTEHRGSVYEQNSRKIMHSAYRFRGEKSDKYLGLVFVAALNVSDTQLHDQNTFEAGEELGQFNMGSTIVMLIEGGRSIKWNCEAGSKVKYGEALCQFTDDLQK